MKKYLLSVFVCLCAVCCLITFAGCSSKQLQVENLQTQYEFNCGDDVNMLDYLSKTVSVSKNSKNAPTSSLRLSDLDIEFKSWDNIIDNKSYRVDTSKMGSFNVELVAKDKDGEKGSSSFKLNLNPIKIEKGLCTWTEPVLGPKVEGFCSYQNTSSTPLAVDSISFEFIGLDGVTLSSEILMLGEISSNYLDPGPIGFAVHHMF